MGVAMGIAGVVVAVFVLQRGGGAVGAPYF